ncbi:MAG: NADH-quinone oxidoreductase subunit C [Terracidiphilus sp.]|nr:NADH-quinone oxidoreductase subunit C [Terracidiphilus sp.]
MTALEAMAAELGAEKPWTTEGGALWLEPSGRTVREVAEVMKAHGARFITITTYEQGPGEEMRLEYHWDLGGKLLGVRLATHEHKVESIFDLCEAADWIEREVHEEYGIEFTGREYEPLLLREGAAAGVNLREEMR